MFEKIGRLSFDEALEALAEVAVRPVSVEKRAFLGQALTGVGNFVRNNPVLGSALVGGGLGAATGGVATALNNYSREEDDQRSVWRGLLGGGLAGAAVGSGVGALRSALGGGATAGPGAGAGAGAGETLPTSFGHNGQRFQVTATDPKVLDELRRLQAPSMRESILKGTGNLVSNMASVAPVSTLALPYNIGAEIAAKWKGARGLFDPQNRFLSRGLASALKDDAWASRKDVLDWALNKAPNKAELQRWLGEQSLSATPHAFGSPAPNPGPSLAKRLGGLFSRKGGTLGARIKNVFHGQPAVDPDTVLFEKEFQVPVEGGSKTVEKPSTGYKTVVSRPDTTTAESAGTQRNVPMAGSNPDISKIQETMRRPAQIDPDTGHVMRNERGQTIEYTGGQNRTDQSTTTHQPGQRTEVTRSSARERIQEPAMKPSRQAITVGDVRRMRQEGFGEDWSAKVPLIGSGRPWAHRLRAYGIPLGADLALNILHASRERADSNSRIRQLIEQHARPVGEPS